MAKQNFLSGGFYGKLGQVVGQRWKNIRTIRTYVIPNDPKTPLQLEQRSKFKSSVVYAQAAMMSNYYSNWFDNPSMSRWNVRMSTARELIKTYESFLSRLPLIPINVEPPFPITQIKYAQDPTTKDVTFTLNSDFAKAKRSISIYATNNPDTENPDDVLLLVAENQDEYWKRFTVPNVQNFNFDNNTHIRIVSNDDTNSSELGLVSSEQTGSVDFTETYPLDLTLKDILISTEFITFTFNEVSLKERHNVAWTGFEAIINGVKQTIDPAPVLVGWNDGDGDRICVKFRNVWGTKPEQITFDSSCKWFITKWIEYTNDNSLRFVMGEKDISLTTPIYKTGPDFDFTVKNAQEKWNAMWGETNLYLPDGSTWIKYPKYDLEIKVNDTWTMQESDRLSENSLKKDDNGVWWIATYWSVPYQTALANEVRLKIYDGQLSFDGETFNVEENYYYIENVLKAAGIIKQGDLAYYDLHNGKVYLGIECTIPTRNTGEYNLKPNGIIQSIPTANTTYTTNIYLSNGKVELASTSDYGFDGLLMESPYVSNLASETTKLSGSGLIKVRNCPTFESTEKNGGGIFGMFNEVIWKFLPDDNNYLINKTYNFPLPPND